MIKVCWHGAASLTLVVKEVEILVDPYFSSKEDYGAWYTENVNKPEWEFYLANFAPDLVHITHGHFDHFDLEAVKRLEREKHPLFMGSAEVGATLTEVCGVPADRILVLAPGQQISLLGLNFRAIEGVHWNTGEEGTRIAAFFKTNPAKYYGAMPCGGPMLGLIIDSGEEKVYISGDTELEGIPDEKVDIACLNIGAPVYDPKTKGEGSSVVNGQEATLALNERLQPRVAIPLHHDFALFLREPDIQYVRDHVRARFLELVPNQWYEVG